MSKQKLGERTICTHTGAVEDPIFRGAVSPIYLSTSYDFIDQDPKRYPRYFNTPNQEFLSKKASVLVILVTFSFLQFIKNLNNQGKLFSILDH